MTIEEIISSLELLKAEIEWDKSIEYQITLDEAIKILRKTNTIDEIYNKLDEGVCNLCKHRGFNCVSCNEKGYEMETFKEWLKEKK